MDGHTLYKMRWYQTNRFRVFVALLAMVGIVSIWSRVETEKTRQLTIGFAAMNVEMTWMKFAYHAMHKKAAELGVKLITYDANNEVAKQAINVNDLVKRGVDGIITDPVEVKGLIPALKWATRKGVPVVAFDRSAVGAPYLFFVGSDDVEAGRLACRFLADRLNGAGKLIVLEGAIGSSPAINRSQGFHDQQSKYPALEIVFKKSGGFLREEGYRLMEEALATVTSFDAIYSQNDDMILGAIEAMEKAGVSPEKILTIGTDGIPEALKAIREGRLDATIQYPISQAEIALEKLVQYLRSNDLPEWKEYLVKPWVITKDNISSGDFYLFVED